MVARRQYRSACLSPRVSDLQGIDPRCAGLFGGITQGPERHRITQRLKGWDHSVRDAPRSR
jgi:hypothetical protein